MKSKISRLFVVAAASAMLLASCKTSDADIQKEFADKQKDDAALAGVSAMVADGVVTLNGQSKDDATKTQAGTDVQGLKGVKSVTNNLTVMPPPVQPMPVEIHGNDQLLKDAKAAAAKYPSVTIDVKDSVIWVGGSIARADWMKLKPALDATRPKKNRC